MIMKYSDSRTCKDLLHQIPKLSRPYSLFKDFPGPGKMTTFFQGLSRPCGHPGGNIKLPRESQTDARTDARTAARTDDPKTYSLRRRLLAAEA